MDWENCEECGGKGFIEEEYFWRNCPGCYCDRKRHFDQNRDEQDDGKLEKGGL